MADLYRVKAPVVKVSIGSLEGNRVARILRAGAIVPDGVAAESLASLEQRGFLEKVAVEEAPEADSAADIAAAEQAAAEKEAAEKEAAEKAEAEKEAAEKAAAEKQAGRAQAPKK